jgi:hypothetical protein
MLRCCKDASLKVQWASEPATPSAFGVETVSLFPGGIVVPLTLPLLNPRPLSGNPSGCVAMHASKIPRRSGNCSGGL